MIDEHLQDPTERRILELQFQSDAYRRALTALQNCGSLEDVQQIAAAVLERVPGELRPLPQADQPLDLQLLQQLIKAASRGSWRDNAAAGWIDSVDGEIVCQTWDKHERDYPNHEANRAYIAAMHPLTGQRLIAAISATLAFLTTVSPHRSSNSAIEGDSTTLVNLMGTLEHIGVAVPGGVQLRERLERERQQLAEVRQQHAHAFFLWLAQQGYTLIETTPIGTSEPTPVERFHPDFLGKADELSAAFARDHAETFPADDATPS